MIWRTLDVEMFALRKAPENTHLNICRGRLECPLLQHIGYVAALNNQREKRFNFLVQVRLKNRFIT